MTIGVGIPYMYAFFVLLLLMCTGAMATEALVEGVKLISESPPVFSMLGSPKIFLDNDVKWGVYRNSQGKIYCHTIIIKFGRLLRHILLMVVYCGHIRNNSTALIIKVAMTC